LPASPACGQRVLFHPSSALIIPHFVRPGSPPLFILTPHLSLASVSPLLGTANIGYPRRSALLVAIYSAYWSPVSSVCARPYSTLADLALARLWFWKWKYQVQLGF
jgi:hypothetical protein